MQPLEKRYRNLLERKVKEARDIAEIATRVVLAGLGENPFEHLNDGVRLNLRPFLTVGDVKKKNIGFFPFKPNIKWGKDRGKDLPSAAPW